MIGISSSKIGYQFLVREAGQVGEELLESIEQTRGSLNVLSPEA